MPEIIEFSTRADGTTQLLYYALNPLRRSLAGVLPVQFNLTAALVTSLGLLLSIPLFDNFQGESFVKVGKCLECCLGDCGVALISCSGELVGVVSFQAM